MEGSCPRGLNFVRPLFSVKILPEMTIQHSDSCAHLQMNDHQDMWSCKSTYSLSLISLCQSLSIYWPFYYTNKQSIFLLHAKRLSRFKFSLLHITEFFRDVPLEKTTAFWAVLTEFILLSYLPLLCCASCLYLLNVPSAIDRRPYWNKHYAYEPSGLYHMFSGSINIFQEKLKERAPAVAVGHPGIFTSWSTGQINLLTFSGHTFS